MPSGPFRVPVLPRHCGDCDVCCTVLGVRELGKAEFTRCSHQVDGVRGCSVYADRPDSCGEFRCLWTQGALGHRDRPDRLGVMLDLTFSEDPRTGAVQHGVHGVIAVEHEEGGFDRARPRLRELASKVDTFIVRRMDGSVVRFDGRDVLPAGPVVEKKL